MHRLVASLIVVATASAAFAQPVPPAPYNPTADANAQVAAALKLAKEDGIHVLLTFGTNTDDASQAFAVARRSKELSQFFSTEFKVVNIEVGENRNHDVARNYGVTLTAGSLPMLAVLDADGKVLARQSASAFRSDGAAKAFDTAKIGAFLTTHRPPPAPDADPVLADALQRAKSEGKTLFVWFSAPW